MIKVYTDGGSRGNPGKSACAFLIVKNKKVLYKKAKFLGIKTNNEAEYNAIIIALDWTNKDNRFSKKQEIEIISDSELVIRQINGEYKIKKKHLDDLKIKIISLIKNKKVKFSNSKRENPFIAHADLLVNQKLDES